jgi:hypothetical protein
MPHDCAGPAVFDVTMFGISQVVPASRSSQGIPTRLERCSGNPPGRIGATDFLFLTVLRLRLLSRQPFGPQPFQVLAQGLLLLFVFGQWSIRWTEHVCFIFAFAHDVIFLWCGLRRLSCLRRSSFRDFCRWSGSLSGFGLTSEHARAGRCGGRDRPDTRNLLQPPARLTESPGRASVSKNSNTQSVVCPSCSTVAGAPRRSLIKRELIFRYHALDIF